MAETSDSNFRKKLLVRLIVGSVIVSAGFIVLFPFLDPNAGNKCSGDRERPHLYVGSLNRAQQAYHLERGKFTSSFKGLVLGFDAQTENYVYLTVNFRQVVFNYALSKQKYLKSVVGGVFVTKSPKTKEVSTLAILCEAELPGTQPIEPPINAQTCGAGKVKLNQ